MVMASSRWYLPFQDSFFCFRIVEAGFSCLFVVQSDFGCFWSVLDVSGRFLSDLLLDFSSFYFELNAA